MEGNTFEKELAEIGACKDKWGNNTISCYKCELKFNVEEINEKIGDRYPSFVDAGWLIHTIHHPWCGLLQSIPEETLQKILGSINVF